MPCPLQAPRKPLVVLWAMRRSQSIEHSTQPRHPGTPEPSPQRGSLPSSLGSAPEGLCSSGMKKKRLQMQWLHHPLHTVLQRPELRCATPSASTQGVVSLELDFSKCLQGHLGPSYSFRSFLPSVFSHGIHKLWSASLYPKGEACAGTSELFRSHRKVLHLLCLSPRAIRGGAHSHRHPRGLLRVSSA